MTKRNELPSTAGLVCVPAARFSEIKTGDTVWCTVVGDGVGEVYRCKVRAGGPDSDGNLVTTRADEGCGWYGHRPNGVWVKPTGKVAKRLGLTPAAPDYAADAETILRTLTGKRIRLTREVRDMAAGVGFHAKHVGFVLEVADVSVCGCGGHVRVRVRNPDTGELDWSQSQRRTETGIAYARALAGCVVAGDEAAGEVEDTYHDQILAILRPLVGRKITFTEAHNEDSGCETAFNDGTLGRPVVVEDVRMMGGEVRVRTNDDFMDIYTDPDGVELAKMIASQANLVGRRVVIPRALCAGFLAGVSTGFDLGRAGCVGTVSEDTGDSRVRVQFEDDMRDEARFEDSEAGRAAYNLLASCVIG